MITGGVLVGPEARVVGVEVSMRGGLPGLTIVGLAGRSVQEAGRRVRSALAASGCRLPPRQFVVGLAPAELPKHGASLDLAIAVSLLIATGRLASGQFAGSAFWGGLGLDGSVQPVRGVLAFAVAAKRSGSCRLVVSPADAGQASMAGLEVCVVRSVAELIGAGPLQAPDVTPPRCVSTTGVRSESAFLSIAGLAGPVRAATIAAAGGHHCCFFGPPGAGKSLLARAIHALLPAPTGDELVEIAALAALDRTLDGGGEPATVECGRPLREPLIGVSRAALIGRGRPFAPGEVSLAHRGVLVLDEVAGHRADVLQDLCLCIDRALVELHSDCGLVQMPAGFQVAATSNLCPCGRTGSANGPCTCSAAGRAAFWRRLSGPFVDRLDLQVEVLGPELFELDGLLGPTASDGQPGSDMDPDGSQMAGRRDCLSSASYSRLNECRRSVASAWAIAERRYGTGRRNGQAADSDLLAGVLLSPAARIVLAQAHRELGLSARGYLSVLRVARTIADLAAEEMVQAEHLAEAASYRARPWHVRD